MKNIAIPGLRAALRPVTEKELKTCALCGALNFHKNAECFICGWQGHFDRDATAVHWGWQRLYDRFEGVTLAHVTARRRPSALDAIEPRPTPLWERGVSALRGAWNRWQARRSALPADRNPTRTSRPV